MSRLRFWSLSLLVLGAAALSAAPAQAQATASFKGKCNWNPTFTEFTCTFDAQRPPGSSACPGSYIWKYRWDFDDGTSSGLTGNSTYTRSFPGSTDPFVTLTVLCMSGEFPSQSRLVCVHAGVPGCIRVDGNWW